MEWDGSLLSRSVFLGQVVKYSRYLLMAATSRMDFCEYGKRVFSCLATIGKLFENLNKKVLESFETILSKIAKVKKFIKDATEREEGKEAEES